MNELIVQSIFLLVFICFTFVLLRTMFKGLDYSTRRYSTRHSFYRESKIVEEELKKQSEKRSEMLERVSKYSRENPTEMASILNQWLLMNNGD